MPILDSIRNKITKTFMVMEMFSFYCFRNLNNHPQIRAWRKKDGILIILEQK